MVDVDQTTTTYILRGGQARNTAEHCSELYFSRLSFYSSICTGGSKWDLLKADRSMTSACSLFCLVYGFLGTITQMARRSSSTTPR